MTCNHCGGVMPEGAVFCPYCGMAQAFVPQNPPSRASEFSPHESIATAQVPYAQPNYAQLPYGQDPYGQFFYGQEGYAPMPQAYYMPTCVSESDMSTVRTLGLVALIVGIFVPLAGYICGGIGLAKISKLLSYAYPLQVQALKKSRVLCLLGIIIPFVLSIGSSLLVNYLFRS